MDIDLLIRTLFLYGEPEPEAITYLTHTLKEQVLRPNKILISEGFTNRRLYFLANGLVREYRNTPKGERTTGFATPGNFFADTESFIKQQPAPASISTETGSVILSLNYSEHQHLITRYPSTEKILNTLHHHYSEQRKRIEISLLDNPIEMQIQTLKQEQPEVFMYCKIKHIISFLRIDYKTYQKAFKKI